MHTNVLTHACVDGSYCHHQCHHLPFLAERVSVLYVATGEISPFLSESHHGSLGVEPEPMLFIIVTTSDCGFIGDHKTEASNHKFNIYCSFTRVILKYHVNTRVGRQACVSSKTDPFISLEPWHDISSVRIPKLSTCWHRISSQNPVFIKTTVAGAIALLTCTVPPLPISALILFR